MKVYVDGTEAYAVKAAQFSTSLPMAVGTRRITVRAWSGTTSFAKTIYVTVGSNTSGCTPGPTIPSVTICTPTDGSTVTSPVTVKAAARASSSISAMKIYLDGTGVYTVNASSLSTPVTMGAGTHRLTVKAWTTSGTNFGSTIFVTATSPAQTLSVSPRQQVLTIGRTQQFTANASVRWLVDGVEGGSTSSGTISTSGLYTAPQSAGMHMVTAVSTTNSSTTASATVWTNNYAGVFTQHNDRQRTGQNLQEIALSPATINKSGFGKVFSYAVDGDIYAQPLYVSNLLLPNLGTRNVVFVATEHDSIYAFDADGIGSNPIWKRSFIDPSRGITTIPVTTADGTSCCFSEIGITGTPVIDPGTFTMYVVVRTRENLKDVQRLHALDIRTGQLRPNSGVVIDATVQGSGIGGDGSSITFHPLRSNQRAGLLLLNGVVWVAWGSHDDVQPYHGWVMGFDANTLAKVATWTPTPDGEGAGIWQAGGGLSADENGYIYAAMADGSFSASTGGRDYGNAYAKLDITSAQPSVADWFMPANAADLDDRNLDVGSGGAMLVPRQDSTPANLIITGTKEGTIYVIDRDNMGHFASDHNNNVQTLPTTMGIIRSLPAYWNGNVYFIAMNSLPTQFKLQNSLLSPFATSGVTFGFPGATPSISANGNGGGVLWALRHSSGPAVLYAFDASKVSTLLYSSAELPTRDSAANSVRFAVPTVANGRVYVGGKGGLTVYGLLP